MSVIYAPRPKRLKVFVPAREQQAAIERARMAASRKRQSKVKS